MTEWLKWFGWQDDIMFKNELLAHIIALDDVYVPFERKRLLQAKKKADREQQRQQKKANRRANARKLR